MPSLRRGEFLADFLLPMMGNARDPVTRSIIKLLIANFERYEAFVQNWYNWYDH